jgi:hypothetical protein
VSLERAEQHNKTRKRRVLIDLLEINWSEVLSPFGLLEGHLPGPEVVSPFMKPMLGKEGKKGAPFFFLRSDDGTWFTTSSLQRFRSQISTAFDQKNK